MPDRKSWKPTKFTNLNRKTEARGLPTQIELSMANNAQSQRVPEARAALGSHPDKHEHHGMMPWHYKGAWQLRGAGSCMIMHQHGMSPCILHGTVHGTRHLQSVLWLMCVMVWHIPQCMTDCRESRACRMRDLASRRIRQQGSKMDTEAGEQDRPVELATHVFLLILINGPYNYDVAPAE
jgi:hypothetical protein